MNVSSHQAQRAVPGALPYATAKAAIPVVRTDGAAANTVAQTKAATPAPATATQTDAAKPASGQTKASLEEAVAEMLRYVDHTPEPALERLPAERRAEARRRTNLGPA